MGERRNGTNAIDERAIAWVCLLDKRTLSSSERAELDAWLDADPRHHGAFVRADAAWRSLDRLRILPGETKDPSRRKQWMSRRAMLAAGGAAAGIAAAAAAFIWVERGRIETPIGEIRHVPLEDGSLADVNTNSALSVSFKPNLREITLDMGEAWFDVAKDRNRPFVVVAGNVRVRAVGTAFSVHRLSDGADVLVTEGAVETWTVGDQNHKRIAAGSKMFVSEVAGPTVVVEIPPTQIIRTLAWRNGEIALDGETLAQAAAEFNRYNERRLVIDPALSDKRLVGWFHTDEPETFARAAATTLGAIIIESDDEIRLAPLTE
jgi:transmembrane sensor